MLRWIYERAGVTCGEEECFRLARNISSVLSRELYPSINVGSLCNRMITFVHEFLVTSAAYYEELKLKSNRAARELIPAARDFIQGGREPAERFERACYLAAASNISPIGIPSKAFEFREVAGIIRGERSLLVLVGDVYGAVQGKSRVFYLADNAGEIGFDSLLIAELVGMGASVTLVVKEAPFFENATRDDALYFALDSLVDKIVSTRGLFVPDESSTPVADAFRQSDLVIAKGTGNYEALKGETGEKVVIFILKVKCAPIAASMGVDIGQFQ